MRRGMLSDLWDDFECSADFEIEGSRKFNKTAFLDLFIDQKAIKALINPQLCTSNPYNGVATRYVASEFANSTRCLC
jgi:hypothetical protein